MTISQLWLAVGLMALFTAGAACAAPPIEATTAAAVADGTISRAVGATVVRLDPGVRFLVDGLAYEDVTAWDWNGVDITAPLQVALADGLASQRPTAVGFEVEWKQIPKELRLDGDGTLGVKAAALGLAVASTAPVSCPASVPFGAAVSPTLPADAKCLYGSATCLDKTKRHAGIDYPGAGNAVAIAAGVVVRTELMSASDHGMGSNVIVRHLLPGPDCAIVYSSYSHLASIAAGIAANVVVTKGQALGVIGGSGNGNPNAYAKHLHLEMKSLAVTGNPFGAGNLNKTCATDPLNAKASTCWRYVGTAASSASAPDDYGYLDPAGFLGKTLTIPSYRQVGAGYGYTCAVKVDNTLACWGNNSKGKATPPAGRFKQVSAGDSGHACAVTTDNTLACWGDSYNDGSSRPPTGSFKQVSAGGGYYGGGSYGCAIKANNTLSCWGNNNGNGRTTPPTTGSFQQVSAGQNHACALKTDNTLACWGDNAYGQATPPAGKFLQVDAGIDFSCGLRPDGFVTCWGSEVR